MTLVAAVRCADGVLLASDSQGTQAASGQPIRLKSKKIHCQWSNIAWGSSGDGGMTQRIAADLSTQFPKTNTFETRSLLDIRRELSRVISKATVQLREQHQPHPHNRDPLTASFVFIGGTVAQGPFIIEIDDRCADTDYTDVGHLSIGSGNVFSFYAMAGLSSFNVHERPMAQVKLIVHRMITDAIGVAAFGLGPPIQMIEVVKDSSKWIARELDEATVQTIGDNVTLLRELEADCLDQFGLPST